MKNKVKWIALACLLLGAALIIFGIVKNFFGSKSRDKEYNLYTQQTIPEEEAKNLISQARRYNDDRSGYNEIPEQLGWIVIDKINLKYTVYRTTEDDTLAEGIVHVVGTDLPVLEDQTDVMLMGHNGEAGKALFTNLDQLTIGDEVFLDFQTGEFHYQVTGTEVVEPDEVHLYRSEGSTLTLMTCTPYGSNTHRLLVHCKLEEKEN